MPLGVTGGDQVAMFVYQKADDGDDQRSNGGHALEHHSVPHPLGKLNGRRILFGKHTAVYQAGQFGGDEEIIAVVGEPFDAATMPLATDEDQDSVIRRLLEEVSNRDEGKVGMFRTWIKVRVPNLKKLPDPGTGDEYVKIGGTNKHQGPTDANPTAFPDNNHWGAEDVINALPVIAQKSRQSPPNGLGVTNKIKYNDISLVFGEKVAREG